MPPLAAWQRVDTVSQRGVVERESMPRRIRLEPHLTNDELHSRYWHTCDPAERGHWHFLWRVIRTTRVQLPGGTFGESGDLAPQAGDQTQE
jgi:hypothetical protein